MKANFSIMVVGLVIMFVGAQRAFPMKINRQFLLLNGPAFAMLVFFVGLAAWSGGIKSVGDGIGGTMCATASFLPMMATLFPLMGFGAIVAVHYHKEITHALTGSFGYLWALAASTLIAGSNTACQIVENAWIERSARPVLLYFLVTTPMVSAPIFLIRQMGLKWEIALPMYQVSWAIAVALMPVFWIGGKIIR